MQTKNCKLCKAFWASEWVSLDMGVCGRVPEILVVCVHIIAIACWPGAMSFMLSNPSKDVGRLLPFYARFPDWVTEFSSPFSKGSRVEVCCHYHWDSDGGFGGMAHVTSQDSPLDIPDLRICIVNEPPR